MIYTEIHSQLHVDVWAAAEFGFAATLVEKDQSFTTVSSAGLIRF